MGKKRPSRKSKVRLVRVKEENKTLFGAMKGTLHILGDIVAPLGEPSIELDKFLSVHDPS